MFSKFEASSNINLNIIVTGTMERETHARGCLSYYLCKVAVKIDKRG